ncbi:flagellar biosynthesis protein FlhF [Clostridium acetobutylicum]|uniref:Flagellar biosynthesis protein FlhF n=1 Tax=Clostridium acetobutylicum (strain ATCC 824 / DSM 792 / JCM 1419 / IAM 19013 / LMG 5710 / NBRC 13948 / NRRL B-527 / VKM B-1787 / 2291 / W) TaxID=272562 RepID=Q97H67_CLOAB|nr:MULTISPECIES: flagellar biosynthesis protein FlhF [Clostridium]AAK80104.1 Flagellar GTP-binding protein, FlhF [Clostridium acetobutylicum ATCC 824]ADZ21197.1 flagellar biosynthesis regulator FlhF [Clostridium acetobutylicum EA 2018]AEI33455.1 flagellar biosynthesis regulator FlhF [Clostridium acetobutylicum DSM 1731]AWV79471.1 flagellar biosynthesis protein FlhF [Clostridium acetobutylicum]MBC2394558.1 flagellar biosynthesis protein FlhF [Clostridium acetobutylicum]
MVVKKYIVKSMNEAMAKIKYDLGSDAVIISQRKVKKRGILGIFSKKLIEVTAAVDNSKDTKKRENIYSKPQYTEENSDLNESVEALKRAMKKHEETTKVEKRRVLEDVKSSGEDRILREMEEMKKLIGNISSSNADQEEKSEIELKLEEADINEGYIKEIVKNIMDDKSDIDLNLKLKSALEKNIEISKTEEKGIITFVGPTGVGKTTTIAKLAGKFSLIEKKKVGLITVDTYRIGAVEQLRTYADIMNLPFKVVLTLKEMDEAIKSMQNCDIILVDTTGRSSKNKMQISELRAFVSKTNSLNINLVISATTKNRDLEAIIDGYRQLDFQNVIITKLDETTTYGSIINILNYAHKPLSYVTTGQNVPDDIRRMAKGEIVSLVLGEDNVC